MSSLGDVVHALPAVTDASLAGVTVDWVVEEAFADIPALHPAVSRVIPIAWRRWRKNLRAHAAEMAEFLTELRRYEYDLVIDSQGLIKSAVVGLLARGQTRGFSFTTAREPWAAFSYAKGYAIAQGQHAVERQRQLFAAALDYVLPDTSVSGLEGDRQTSRQVILLHGTTWPSKHWPQAMWQNLAELALSDGFEPVLTWGNEIERQRALDIATATGANVLDRAAISELANVLARAAVVIGVDSGLCHFAAALGTPTLGLYGPTDGLLTGCRGERTSFLQAQITCSPCLDKQCRKFNGPVPLWQGQAVDPPCFADLPPEKVWQQACKLMVSH
jgi:lipopolysaccharide heptosyltransferase I